MKRYLLVALTALTLVAAEKGWFDHEGGLLKYRVNIRFGEEPDTMPKAGSSVVFPRSLPMRRAKSTSSSEAKG